MYIGNDFLCWCPHLPRFLSDDTEEGFGSTNDNQKLFIHQDKSIMGNKVVKKIFEKYRNKPKKCFCILKNKKHMLSPRSYMTGFI